MMRKSHLLIAALAVAALGASMAGVSAVLADEEVSLQQVPAAVRTTIEKHVGDGRIAEIERETEHGQVVYEVEAVVDGREVEFLVSPTGKYLGAEAEDDDDDDGEDDQDGEDDDDEEAVSWDDLPKAVQTSLTDLLGGVKSQSLTREAEDGFVLYEAAYEADGAKLEVKLTDDGTVIEREQEVAPSALPASVAEQIRKKFPRAEIKAAELVQLTFYEVELKGARRNHEVKVFANGQLLEEED
jgi:uncharacterized membrane protein YkoI